MEKMLLVVSQGATREFDSTKNGQTTKVKALDLELTDKVNTFIIGVAGDKANQLHDHPLKAGTLINADLSFYKKMVKTEKGEFPQQQVRLNNYGVIVEP